MDAKQIELARRMLRYSETTVGEVAGTFGVSAATIYRHVGAIEPARSSDNSGKEAKEQQAWE